MKNINKGLGLIALAIVCSTVLIITKDFLDFLISGFFGYLLINEFLDD